MTDEERVVLTDSQVNKIIAEYMGEKRFLRYLEALEAHAALSNEDQQVLTKECLELVRYVDQLPRSKYTESLDSLVPVWEKLNKIPKEFRADLHWDNDINTYPEKMTYAAAHATAKAILELKK